MRPGIKKGLNIIQPLKIRKIRLLSLLAALCGSTVAASLLTFCLLLALSALCLITSCLVLTAFTLLLAALLLLTAA